jgi:hypothetical protein
MVRRSVLIVCVLLSQILGTPSGDTVQEPFTAESAEGAE